MGIIEVELPKGFMNVGITTCNNLVADTNDSSKWDTIKFPLPKGRWSIKTYKNNNKTVVLRKKHFLGR